MLVVHHGEEQLLPPARPITQEPCDLVERHVDRQGDHVATHDLAHEEDLERVDRELAAEVVAAPADLLGENRATESQHREAVRERDGDEERQQHVHVVGQLEREHDAREGRAHRAAEDAAHQ